MPTGIHSEAIELEPAITNGRPTRLVAWTDAAHLGREAVYDLHKEHINSVFVRLLKLMDLDKMFVRGEGAYVWDAEGTRYLDFFGGFGCVNLGHHHPAIVRRLQEFLTDQHPVVFQTIAGRFSAALARNLAAIAPGELEVSFLCSTGTEATEGALKLARKATGRQKIVYTTDAYHGRTLGSLSVMGHHKLQLPFGPLLPKCVPVPFGDAAALEEQLRGRDAAAFIVEPIQGHAGIVFPPPGYLKECERLCHEYGTLLIVDEVQTGMGRTGKMFACEHEGVEPDIMTIGKSLGGGLVPVAAFITTRPIWTKAYGNSDDFTLHASTFGGNGLAAAAGLATIETIYDENLLERASELGAYLTERLEALKHRHPVIHDVRGRGLMVAIELGLESSRLRERTANSILGFISERLVTNVFLSRLINEHHVVVGASLTERHCFRIYPPLVTTREQIDTFVDAFDGVCSALPGFSAILARVAGRVVKGSLRRKP